METGHLDPQHVEKYSISGRRWTNSEPSRLVQVSQHMSEDVSSGLWLGNHCCCRLCNFKRVVPTSSRGTITQSEPQIHKHMEEGSNLRPNKLSPVYHTALLFVGNQPISFYFVKLKGLYCRSGEKWIPLEDKAELTTCLRPTVTFPLNKG